VDASAPLSEVELEMLGGSARRIFDLARELSHAAPLRLGVLSKSERGYRLLAGQQGKLVKAEPLLLTPELTAGEGWQRIAMACLRHFRLNEARFTGEREGAALHQMRVALRRLRSALTLFSPIADDAELPTLRQELRWVSGLLGAARDRDVFVQQRLDSATVSTDLWSQVLQQREQAFDEAIAAIESERFRLLMLRLVEWVAIGDWLEDKGAAGVLRDQPVTEFAATALRQLYKKVRKRGHELAALNDADRHKLRIAGKKLRYASEFFTSLFEGDKHHSRQKAFLAALEELQQHLGDLNDLVTARFLLQDIACGLPSEQLQTELLAVADPGAPDQRRKLLAAAERAYDALIAAGAYWR
jgi:inorganic triphosphatase YgiF